MWLAMEAQVCGWGQIAPENRSNAWQQNVICALVCYGGKQMLEMLETTK
jgi:hypothetical protein